MKRQRDSEGTERRLESANCLMLLSQFDGEENGKPRGNCREFECKTCKRKFSSFQALGGHRASHNHKRPKPEGEEELKAQAKCLSLGNKHKMHECSICGVGFSVGQALGGHMRKHRGALGHHDFGSVNEVVPQVPLLKRCNSSTSRAVCLDLNLTPLENDLKLLFGNVMAHPVIDAFV